MMQIAPHDKIGTRCKWGQHVLPQIRFVMCLGGKKVIVGFVVFLLRFWLRKKKNPLASMSQLTDCVGSLRDG